MVQSDRTDVLAAAAAGDELAFRQLITELPPAPEPFVAG